MATSENDGPLKSDELGLEPVDALELNIEVVQTVEIAVLTRAGMGFWKAFLWCLLFLLTTQILPALLLIPPFLLFDLPAIQKRIQEEQRIAFEKGEEPPSRTLLESITDSPELNRMNMIAGLAGPFCGIIFSCIFIPRVVGRDWRRRLAFRVPHFEHVVLVVLLVFPVLVFNMAFESLMYQVTGDFGRSIVEAISKTISTWPGWVLILAIAVGPGISEELFCRGFLGQGLVGRYGIWWGTLATAFFFGFIHLNPLQFGIAFLIGIVLQLVYISTRSIWITILFHLLHNLFIALSTSKDAHLEVAESLEQAFSFQPGLMLFAAGLMAVAIGWAFACSRVRIWMADGNPAPANLYPHVELPVTGSANQADLGQIPTSVVLSVLVTTAFFTAVWFGL